MKRSVPVAANHGLSWTLKFAQRKQFARVFRGTGVHCRGRAVAFGAELRPDFLS
jgi:hypothetical protein